MKALIYFPNDPSVGIFAACYEVTLPLNGFEDSEHREWIRDSIIKLWNEMDGEFVCQVFFEDEKEYDRILRNRKRKRSYPYQKPQATN